MNNSLHGVLWQMTWHVCKMAKAVHSRYVGLSMLKHATCSAENRVKKALAILHTLPKVPRAPIVY